MARSGLAHLRSSGRRQPPGPPPRLHRRHSWRSPPHRWRWPRPAQPAARARGPLGVPGSAVVPGGIRNQVIGGRVTGAGGIPAGQGRSRATEKELSSSVPRLAFARHPPGLNVHVFLLDPGQQAITDRAHQSNRTRAPTRRSGWSRRPRSESAEPRRMGCSARPVGEIERVPRYSQIRVVVRAGGRSVGRRRDDARLTRLRRGAPHRCRLAGRRWQRWP